jgi:voltage-gated potassium channel
LRLFKILNHPKFTSQSAQLNQAITASKGKIIFYILCPDQHHNYWFYNVCGRRQRKWFYQHPASIWTIVTLTTVGYGDISPETPLGQFIASFVMILGYGIIAVPTGIVTAEIAKSTQNKIVTDKTMYWLRHRRLSRKRQFCPHCTFL